MPDLPSAAISISVMIDLGEPATIVYSLVM